MDLPNLFSKQTSESKNLFITLLLTDQSVQSGLWYVADQKIIISNQSNVRYFGNDEERLIQIDEALQDLGQESEETDEVLLGLEPNWVNEQGILAARKQELKKITDDLSLNAVGFVLTTEALFQYFVQQNNYLSTVILYVGAKFIELILARQGKQVASLSVGRSDDIVLDLKEALARLEQDANSQGKKLPSSLLLASAVVDQEKLQNYQQQLLEVDWQQELQFVQTPVIEIFNSEKLLKVVTREGGRAIAQANQLVPQDETAEKAQSENANTTETKDKMSSFGVPVASEQESNQPPSLPQKKSSLNFQASTQGGTTAVPETAAAVPASRKIMEKNSKFKIFGRVFGSKFNKKSSSQQPSLQPKTFRPQKRRVSAKSNKIKLIALIGVVAGFLVSAVIGYFYLKQNYQAQVFVQPATVTVNKELTIKLDPNIQETDTENLVLKASVVTKEVYGSDSLATTGVKLVGEKAQGEVVLLNKTNEEKTFEAGTELSHEDLKFTLDDDVTVPAATIEENPSGDGETKKYGQATAAITAVEIGADSNLTQDTTLSIAQFSQDTYAAKLEEDLTGGSSREIRVVAEEDRQELLTTLRQRLLKQAKDEFETESGNGQYITPTNNYEIVKQEYSAEVGDEVEQLSLDLSLSVQGITYTMDDLKLLGAVVLQSEVPEGYRLLDQQPEILSQPAEETETADQVMLEIQLSSQAVADLNSEEIQQSISGMLMTEAQTSLVSDGKIFQAEIKLSPQIAYWFFKTLPSDQERIELRLQDLDLE
jgi:molybdopterin converting factor small subunit